MENDYSTALQNAAKFLNDASAIVNDADTPTLARIGHGWATLALALSQDRQSHAVAESLLQWLNTPTAEGFETMRALVAEWAGVATPEMEIVTSGDPQPQPLDTDQE